MYVCPGTPGGGLRDKNYEGMSLESETMGLVNQVSYTAKLKKVREVLA